MLSTRGDSPPTALAVALVVLVVAGTLPAGVAATEPQSAPAQVTIPELQQPTGDGTASPYAGQNVTTTGTVTAVTDSGFFLQNGTGAYSGVYVYGTTNVTVGDRVTVTGLAKEYNGVTEIDVGTATGNVTATGTASVPAPTRVRTANASQERYEGVRLKVTNLTVTKTPGQFGEWAVSDGSGALAVDDVTHGDVTPPSETGGTIDAVVGPLHYSYGAFKLQPETLTNYTAPTSGGDGSGASNGTQVTVLTYNDIQTAISNPTKTGRLVGIINARRAAIDHPTVVVGGGDQVSPSSLSPTSNWTVPVQVLNTLDPAAEVVGNHDLDYGFDAVRNYSQASRFPWLVANIRQTDGSGGVPGTKNYTIVTRNGTKIGIIGLVDDAVKPKTAVDFDEQGYEVTDFVPAGRRIATDLKQNHGVDVVIAAAHIGVPESKELARNTDNIDVIVTGDDEITYPPQTVDGTTIVEAEARANYVGEVNLTVTNDSVSLAGGRLIENTADSGYPVNATVNQTISQARGKYLSTVAGRTTVPLDSTFSANYAEDTRWGNVITDAFRAETGSEVALTNAGGIRGDFVIQPGPVTYDDIYTSLPFGNYLVTKRLTGEQLKELLASQVTRLDANYGAQAQLQVSGVTYEFVDRPGAQARVTDVHVNGAPLQANATYNVTLNSYMADWELHDRYGWNVSDRPTVDTDYTLYGTAVVNYIETHSPLSPPGVDRIRRVTRTLGTATASQQGDTVTVTVPVPDAVASVNASTVHVENATTGSLAAQSAGLTDGTLTATFDRDNYTALAAQSDGLDLYATYTDGTLDASRNGFAHSVLNAEVAATNTSPRTPGPTLRVGATTGAAQTPLASGTSLPVVLTNASRGVGAYEVTLTVDDPGVARISGFTPTERAGLTNVTVAPSGDRVHVEVALADTTTGTVTLGTLDLTGVTLGGTTVVSVTSVTGPFDENGTAYASPSTDAPVVRVTPGDLTGNDRAMADLDGDGVYEDVNGDGELNVADAQALFAVRNADTTTANAAAFDVNGDGAANVGDVQALFANRTA